MLVLLSRWSKLWAYQAVQTALWLQIIATLTARSLVSARKFEMRSACVGHLGCVLFSNEAVACTLLRASFHLTGSVSQWLGGCFAVRKCFFLFFLKEKQHPKTILYSVSHWDEMGGGAILRAFTSSLLLGDCFPWARCSWGSQQLPHLYSSVEGNLQSSFVQEKEKQTWMGAYCHFSGFLRWMQECVGDKETTAGVKESSTPETAGIWGGSWHVTQVSGQPGVAPCKELFQAWDSEEEGALHMALLLLKQ